MAGCFGSTPCLLKARFRPGNGKGNMHLSERAREKNGSSTRASQEPKPSSHSQTAKTLPPRDELDRVMIPPYEIYRSPIQNCARSLQVVLVHVAATLALGTRRRSTKSARSPMPSIPDLEPIPSLCLTLARLPSPALQAQQAQPLIWHVARAGHHGRLVFISNYTLS